MATTLTKKKVWLDCDPGHDDACAIILAGYMCDLIGISTVMGNQTIEKTTTNALKILSISGLEHVEVVKGQGKPLIKELSVCPEIHGESGLDSRVKIPEETVKLVNEKAVIYMAKKILSCPEKVHLVCTACLTNIALLLQLFPEVSNNIEQIVIMGGSIGIGNIGTVMEWNIMVDPHAAKIVFDSGLKIVQITLNVTHTVLVTQNILDYLKNFKSPFGELMEDLLLYFASTYKKVFNFDHPPLHDPVAVAYVLAPEIFTTELMRVDVEINSELTSGQTVCDVFHFSPKRKNVIMALKVDTYEFWKLMLSAFSMANSNSILNKQKPLLKNPELVKEIAEDLVQNTIPEVNLIPSISPTPDS